MSQWGFTEGYVTDILVRITDLLELQVVVWAA